MEILRRRNVLAVLVLLGLVVLVVGAYLFQPWRLFTSSTVDEPLPGAVATASPSATPPSTGQPTDAGSGPPMAGPGTQSPSTPAPGAAGAGTVIATGAFQSQEHPTSGTASLVKLPDGSLLIRLENLASSDGPDVKIWLSELDAGGDWFKYRAGRYLDLGLIKATHGNHNYLIPAGSDISGLDTVVLWCDRFSVAFGSAALA
jgi:hypothetical protein